MKNATKTRMTLGMECLPAPVDSCTRMPASPPASCVAPAVPCCEPPAGASDGCCDAAPVAAGGCVDAACAGVAEACEPPASGARCAPVDCD